MKTLNRAALLTKEKLEVVLVDLGKDECVYVRQMTAYERDKFEQSLRKEVSNPRTGETKIELLLENFRAKLAVYTVCDEKGTPIFEVEDFETLSKSMSASRMEKIINVAQEINAITEKDKEGLLKNSEADQVGNSTSASAKN